MFNGFFDPFLRICIFPLFDENIEQPVIPGEDFLMYCLHRDQSLVQGTLKVVLRLVNHSYEVLHDTSNEFPYGPRNVREMCANRAQGCGMCTKCARNVDEMW